MTTTTNDALDSLLDQSIDDLADLPEFKVPPTGMYKLRITTSSKEINSKPSVVAGCTVVDTIELADINTPEDERVKADDKFDVPFILTDKDGQPNEIGLGRMKLFIKPFSEHFGEKSIKALVNEKIKDVVVTAKVERKERKGGDGKFDARISSIVID